VADRCNEWDRISQGQTIDPPGEKTLWQVGTIHDDLREGRVRQDRDHCIMWVPRSAHSDRLRIFPKRGRLRVDQTIRVARKWTTGTEPRVQFNAPDRDRPISMFTAESTRLRRFRERDCVGQVEHEPAWHISRVSGWITSIGC
jgi:hypothetical protein